MPKKPALIARDALFIRVYVATGDAAYAATRCGIPADEGEMFLRLPAIYENVFKDITAKIYEGAIIAQKILLEVVKRDDVSPRDKIEAAKCLRGPFIARMGLETKLNNNNSALAEYTIAELRDLVGHLERQRGDQAKPALSANQMTLNSEDLDLLG